MVTPVSLRWRRHSKEYLRGLPTASFGQAAQVLCTFKGVFMISIEELAARLDAAIAINASLERRLAEVEKRLRSLDEDASAHRSHTEDEMISLDNRCDGLASSVSEHARAIDNLRYDLDSVQSLARHAQSAAESAQRTADSARRGYY
jgi:outer membrane murein-binding lipoprotein Lpp